MPEKTAALPILTTAWTPLECWQEQPLHQNGQGGEDNCKSMNLVTQGQSTNAHLQQDGWSLSVLTLETQVPGL